MKSRKKEANYPIIVFRHGLTQEAEHLNRLYSDSGFAGIITSDAY